MTITTTMTMTMTIVMTLTITVTMIRAVPHSCDVSVVSIREGFKKCLQNMFIGEGLPKNRKPVSAKKNGEGRYRKVLWY